MEIFKKSSIYILAAGMYFYHLGAWTYHMDTFSFFLLATYPQEVLSTTYIYIGLIIAFLVASFLAVINSRRSLKAMSVLLLLPATYEIYRIVSTLFSYGSVEQGLFYSHLGIRVSLGIVVIISIIHGLQLRKSLKNS